MIGPVLEVKVTKYFDMELKFRSIRCKTMEPKLGM